MKALELDENLAEAHASLGLTFLNLSWDFESAESEFKRAVELRPSYAPAHHWHAGLLQNLKRFEEAHSHEEKALQFDPYSRVISMGLAISLALLGRIEEAMMQFQQVIELNPDFAFVHGWKSWVHAWLSQYAEAIEEAKKAFDLDKAILTESNLAWVNALAGKKDEAHRILNHITSTATNEYVSSVFIAMVEFALGRQDEGFRLLEKSLEERDPSLLSFASLPWFENYRRGPRWEKIEAKLGLQRSHAP